MPDAFVSAADAMPMGAALRVIGLVVRRWDRTVGALHYIANRWLVLAITVLVAAGILYGCGGALLVFGRPHGSTSTDSSFGIAGPMAVNALVIGYHLVYAIGGRGESRRRQNAN